jgi:hypothetical protein
MIQTDGYLDSDRNEIRVEKIDSTIPFYLAYAYTNINVPFYKVAPILSDFGKYENIFKHIIDMREIKDLRYPNQNLYYIEGKTSFVHGWGIGNLVNFDINSTRIDIKIRPAPMRLIKEYMKERRGVIKYYIRNVYLDGMLIPVDSVSCRIAIRGVSSTNKPIPTWLLSLVIKIIFPGLIKDIETAVKTNEQKIIDYRNQPNIDYTPFEIEY